MAEEQTQRSTRVHGLGRWVRVLSCTLTIAFLGAQGIAALPGGRFKKHLSPDANGKLNPQNPFNYVLFCSGDFEVGMGEAHHSTGALAIGGNASFSNYSFRYNNTAPGERGLSQVVVGGELNFDSLDGLRGNLEVSSAANIHGNNYSFDSEKYHVVEGVTVNFSAAMDNMISRSESANERAQSSSNAKLSQRGGGGWLEVEASVPDGFNKDTDTLIFNLPAGTNVLYVPEGVDCIINVRGETVNTFPQLVYGNFNNNSRPNDAGDERDVHVVWNFAETTTLNMPDNLSVHGAVLAPKAYIKKLGGNTNGAVICKSIYCTSEFHCLGNVVKFTTPTPTPTPTNTPSPTPTNTPTPTKP